MSRNRSIIKNLVVKELKLKYKQSMLGFLWSMITPLVFMAIFNFVFSLAFMDIENYSLFVLTGLIFWQLFSNTTNQTMQSFIRNGAIIKTIQIPIHFFPLASVITELVGLLISFVPFMILMMFFGLEFSWHFILLIPILALFSVMCYGLSVFLGMLNVYLRDISILWNTVNPALFYLSPIAYSIAIIPPEYRVYIKLNPLYHYFQAFRDVLYSNSIPELNTWIYISLTSLVAWVLGKWTFVKLEKGIISNI